MTAQPSQFNFDRFIVELRKQRGKVPQDLYLDLAKTFEAMKRGDTIDVARPVIAKPGEPAWLTHARSFMGLKEVPGPKHNSTILGWVKSLGGWFKDDETPWCGTFVGAMMQLAGQPVPQHWYRAKAWASWGKPCQPCVGAIVVFSRQGGGHVGFLVGESAANWYVLGGNQSNAVNITPIAKNRQVAGGIRWPAGLPLDGKPLPKMSGGTVSRNEA